MNSEQDSDLSHNESNDVEIGSTVPRRIRRSNEQPIKDAVIIIGQICNYRDIENYNNQSSIGSIMIFMTFGLLLEANIRDDGWNDSNEKKFTILCTFLGLILFSLVFGVYLSSKIANCKKTSEPINIENVS